MGCCGSSRANQNYRWVVTWSDGTKKDCDTWDDVKLATTQKRGGKIRKVRK